MAEETVFYDGDCGLCHRAVKLLLRADADGSRFRYAPLGGERFLAHVSSAQREHLPDSLLLLTFDGRLLTRTEALRHALLRLQGSWRMLGHLLGAVPLRWRDATYKGVARIRRRWFRPPDGACPVVPPALRARFDP